MDNDYLPIRKAAEELGIPDLDILRKLSKKTDSLITAVGCDFVGISRFKEGVKAELQAKIDQAARRSNFKSNGGRQIGLLKARIERAPGLIAGKEGAIVAAKKQLTAAQNLHEKSRAKKTVADLEVGLKRLQDNLVKDSAELNRILNEPEE